MQQETACSVGGIITFSTRGASWGYKMGEEGPRVLRKRKRASEGRKEGLPALLEVAARATNIVVFSGSGLSAQSGKAVGSRTISTSVLCKHVDSSGLKE
jgi:hypothetical protein